MLATSQELRWDIKGGVLGWLLLIGPVRQATRVTLRRMPGTARIIAPDDTSVNPVRSLSGIGEAIATLGARQVQSPET